MQKSIFLDTIKGIKTERPPVWFMRQAGRVLPSYQKLKQNHTFWQLMKDPKLAAEVTLLPVHDLGVDAAILFSDILVIPYAMGMGLDFTDSGPKFDNPLKDSSDPIKQLDPNTDKLGYIYDAIDEIIRTKPENIPLIGFCGAPLTVLAYMIQGLGMSHTFTDAVKFIYSNKEVSKELVERITDMSIIYAKEQVKHGISAFQLFETHAGLIPWELYNEMFMPSVRRIAKELREVDCPFIFFPKGIGTGAFHLTPEDCDYLSVDWQLSITEVRAKLSKQIGLQGNLDQRLLLADKKSIELELEKFKVFGKDNFNWIFNLGHGFLPEIPFENAKFVVDWVKNTNWERNI